MTERNIRLEELYREILLLTDPSYAEDLDSVLHLVGTPYRMAKMSEELFSSYAPGALDGLVKSFRTFPASGVGSLIVEGPISYSSTCSHHGLPFFGEAYVGYIPKKRLVGASKLARVVEFYSRMYQVQERMTNQIAEFIFAKADPEFVAVLLRGQHTCMQSRGVKSGANLITTAIRPLPSKKRHGKILVEFFQKIDILQGAK